MKVLVQQRLPRKTNLRCSKCCACHAKRTGDAPSAAPAGAQKHHSPDAPATQNVRLPRKTSLRCSKCCACHAKLPQVLQVLACQTKEPEMLQVLGLPRKTRRRPKSITRRQTSADFYEGAPSVAPAMQNEPEVLQVLRLPRKTNHAPSAAPAKQKRDGAQKHHSPGFRRLKVLQVMCLPCKTRRRPKASLVAGLPPTSTKVLQVLCLPHKTNLRCSKCCACQAKRAGDAPSAVPATRNEKASLVARLPPTSARPATQKRT